IDQMAQVRRGERKNGVWQVEIERPGTYEFTLRRWPAEADLPISAASPEYRAADGVLSAGIALPIAKARIKIANFEQNAPVGPADNETTFTAALPSGLAELQSWFSAADGQEICGAYLVEVRRK